MGVRRKVTQSYFSQGSYCKYGYGTNVFVLECGHTKTFKASSGFRTYCICDDCPEKPKGTKSKGTDGQTTAN